MAQPPRGVGLGVSCLLALGGIIQPAVSSAQERADTIETTQENQEIWKELTERNANVRQFVEQGEHGTAIRLARETITIAEESAGPNHPYTAVTVFGLATVYVDLGNYADATPLYERGLNIYADTLGLADPTVEPWLEDYLKLLLVTEDGKEPWRGLSARIINYAAEGRDADAAAIAETQYRVTAQLVDPDHPAMFASVFNLAHLYQTQNRCTHAEPLYQQALAMEEQLGGFDKPTIGMLGFLLQGYVKCLRKLRKDEEAERIEGRVQEIRASAQEPK